MRNYLLLIIILSSFVMAIDLNDYACKESDSFSAVLNTIDKIDDEIRKQNLISGGEQTPMEEIQNSVRLQGDLFKLKQACNVYLSNYLSMDLNCKSDMSESEKKTKLEIIDYQINLAEDIPAASIALQALANQRKKCLGEEVLNECSAYGATDVDLKYNSSELESLIMKSITNELNRGSDKYHGFLFAGLINFHLADKELAIYDVDNEDKLVDALIAESVKLNKKLNPGEVLSVCLRISENKLADGILLCHNVLRDSLRDTRTYGTSDTQLADSLANLQGQIEQNQKVIESSPNERAINVAKSAISDLTIAKKNIELLNSLEKIRESDNVGAWYHLYGTLIEGYGVWNWLGQFRLWFEHKVFKRVKGGNYDAVEHCWDNWGLDIGAKIKNEFTVDRFVN